MDKALAALAWYSESEYSKFRTLSADPEVWCQDYESWKSKAEDLIRNLRREGTEAVKVSLTFAEVEKWCTIQGTQNDASSRSKLAATKLRDDFEAGS